MTFDELMAVIKENYIQILLLILVVSVVYLNMRVNNMEYRLQQTIMYSSIQNQDINRNRFNY